LRPAHLPATEADLAEWSVYADWLIEQGDPLGERLAFELALPALPDRDVIAAFHERVKRHYRPGGATPLAWCLGCVRTLAVEPDMQRMARSAATTNRGAVAQAGDALRHPDYAVLESVSIAYDGSDERRWRKLFASLPASCTRMSLGLIGVFDDAAIAGTVAHIPGTVRDLTVYPVDRSRAVQAGLAPGNIARFVDDRFDVVEIPATVDELAAALARTDRVRIRMTRAEAALVDPRVVFGRPGDAALLQPARLRAVPVPRATLLAQQRRYGPIPARTQIARTLPEDHALGAWEGIITVYVGGDLVRRGDDWTLRAPLQPSGRESMATPMTRVDGAAITPGRAVAVGDGSRIAIDDVEVTLVNAAGGMPMREIVARLTG
jgi:hypothetical protein